jgi:hypothetical protein
MKNVVFYNKQDRPSKALVECMRRSDLLHRGSFTLYHVTHPSQMSEDERFFLDLLEVRSVPTLFFAGQQFAGEEAHEWLQYQLGGGSQAGPVGIGPVGTACGPPPPEFVGTGSEKIRADAAPELLRYMAEERKSAVPAAIERM